MNRYAFILIAIFFNEICFAQAAQAPCKMSNGAITDTDNCWAQPQTLKTTIYKIGLCTAKPTAPTVSSAIDLSSCQTVFESNTGVEVSVVKGLSSKLSGKITTPPIGTYTYSYTIVSPTIKTSTILTFATDRSNWPTSGPASMGRVCWSQQGNFYSLRSSVLTDLVQCGNGAPSYIGETNSHINMFDISNNIPVMTKDFGTIVGHLVDSNYKTATSSPSSLGTISYIIGVMPGNPSWVVTSSTKNLDFSLNITLGTAIDMYGTKIEAFGSGPFNPIITLN